MIVLFVLVAFQASAQGRFQAHFEAGTEGFSGYNSLAETPDGGFFIAANSLSFGNITPKILGMKIDGEGNLEWSKSYGGDTADNVTAVAATRDSGFVILGYSNSFHSSNDLRTYLVKTDSMGNVVWSNVFEGNQASYGHDIIPASDGGYLIAGTTYDQNNNTNGFIFKTDRKGNLQWEKSKGGNFSEDIINDIAPVKTGGYLLAGYYSSSTSGGKEGLLIKINGKGETIWAKSYDGPGYNADVFISISQDMKENILAVGVTRSAGAGNRDFLAVQTDPDGNLKLAKVYGGPNEETAYAGFFNGNNGWNLMGRTNSFGAGFDDYYLVNTDSKGNVNFARTFGTPYYEFFVSGISTRDGGSALLARTSFLGAGKEEVYLVKTDTNYNSGCLEQDVSATSNDINLLVTNHPDSTLTVTSSVTSAITSPSTPSVKAGKKCSECRYLPEAEFEFSISGKTVVFTPASEFAHSYHWTFGDGKQSREKSPTHIYTTPNEFKVCLINKNFCGMDSTCKMLKISTGSSNPLSKPENVRIYPNPAVKGKVVVEFGKNLQNPAMITLYTPLGEIINKRTLKTGIDQTTLRLEDKPGGIYMLRIQRNDRVITRKITKK